MLLSVVALLAAANLMTKSLIAGFSVIAAALPLLALLTGRPLFGKRQVSTLIRVAQALTEGNEEEGGVDKVKDAS